MNIQVLKCLIILLNQDLTAENAHAASTSLIHGKHFNFVMMFKEKEIFQVKIQEVSPAI